MFHIYYRTPLVGGGGRGPFNYPFGNFGSLEFLIGTLPGTRKRGRENRKEAKKKAT